MTDLRPEAEKSSPLDPVLLPRLGVVVVTYNATDVILDCVESLLSSQGVQLTIAVVDNDSQDGTAALLRDWAAGHAIPPVADDLPFPLPPCPKPLMLLGPDDSLPAKGHALTLIETGVNGGFAAGVNAGLAYLAAQPGVDRFWVLNPDSVVAGGTAAAFARHPGPEGGFSLMGGRVLYCDGTGNIQIDGGTIDRRTGVTGNLNLGTPHATTPAPDPARMDFITGASMVASRRFYEAVGPMPEEYFLYYEEVDWALRRGPMPLIYCPEGIVYHRAGTAIGSPTLGRPASPFSLYFKHRGRLHFMRRYFPAAVPTALAYSLAKAGQLLLKGYPTEARTLLAASFGRPPTADIRKRLSEKAQKAAFGKQA